MGTPSYIFGPLTETSLCGAYLCNISIQWAKKKGWPCPHHEGNSRCSQWPISRPDRFVPGERAIGIQRRRGWVGCRTRKDVTEKYDISYHYREIN